MLGMRPTGKRIITVPASLTNGPGSQYIPKGEGVAVGENFALVVKTLTFVLTDIQR